jgi:ferritin-like metal-binding protein YciE
MTQLASLKQLYVEELKDIYSAETLLVANLPRMVDVASNPELKRAFSNRLNQTREHVSRLETVFQQLNDLLRTLWLCKRRRRNCAV